MPRGARQFTPELIESGRYRYEDTDEYVYLIAQDFGVSRPHFDRLINRWGWRRRSDRPPLGLPPVQRILTETRQAVDAEVRAGGAVEPDTPHLEMGQTDTNASNGASIAQRLERAVEKELAAVELMRAQYGALPQPPVDAERTARTLAVLTETLFKLRRLRSSDAPSAGSDDFDDMPRDIDEFRHALARRIEAFVRSRLGGTVPATGENPGGAAPQ